MSAGSRSYHDTLPPSLVRRLDQLCDQFEVAWRSGSPPRIEDFLSGWQGAERAALVRELFHLEVYYRRGRGEDCRPEEYQARFPDLDPDWLARTVVTPSQATPPTSSRETAPGELRVPGYEVLGLLGRGGMGVVYKARQVQLNRLVALKVILAGPRAGKEERARFQIEAQAAARLDHPHIVRIYDFGEHEGQAYFSMELLEGVSLRALADRPWPFALAAGLIRDLALAIHHAHERQVIHRDLKPANVFIVSGEWVSGESCLADGASMPHHSPLTPLHSPNTKHQTPAVKILDFGLAKQLDSDLDLTDTGRILGTIQYMAPEQASGDRRAIGPGTDIHALGVILYQLLSGRPAFTGDTLLEVLEAIRSRQPIPLASFRADLPAELAAICGRCLRKAPGQRFASAAALAADLESYLEHAPAEGQRPETPPVDLGTSDREQWWRS
jgi:serine/threonine protein kinase